MNRIERLVIPCMLLVATSGLAGTTDVLSHPPVPVAAPEETLVSASILWGSITVVGHDGATVVALATVTGEDDPDRAAIQDRLLDRIRLEVVERGSRIDIAVPSSIPGFYGVDLELKVPSAVSLSLRMERGGEISVRGVDGAVEVTNRNGSVELHDLRAATAVEARNGSIEAAFAAVPQDGAVSLMSLNGSIEASFPPDLQAFVRARTNNGPVVSDFEIVPGAGTVEGLDWEAVDPDRSGLAPRLLTGAIGGGGLDLYLFTANGSVTLHRLSAD